MADVGAVVEAYIGVPHTRIVRVKTDGPESHGRRRAVAESVVRSVRGVLG